MPHDEREGEMSGRARGRTRTDVDAQGNRSVILREGLFCTGIERERKARETMMMARKKNTVRYGGRLEQQSKRASVLDAAAALWPDSDADGSRKFTGIHKRAGRAEIIGTLYSGSARPGSRHAAELASIECDSDIRKRAYAFVRQPEMARQVFPTSRCPRRTTMREYRWKICLPVLGPAARPKSQTTGRP